jgi:hypothetical protein
MEMQNLFLPQPAPVAAEEDASAKTSPTKKKGVKVSRNLAGVSAVVAKNRTARQKKAGKARSQ